MCLKHTVHDGNFRVGYLVHCYVTCLIPCIGGVGQEEKVPAVKGGFHGATGSPVYQHRLAVLRKLAPQDDNDRRLGVEKEAKSFP